MFKEDEIRDGKLVLIFIMVVSVFVGFLICHYTILPLTIDRRAERLGMMHYSYEAGGMIPNDDFKWTLQYLKYGTMR